MKKKHFFYLAILLVAGIFLATCKKDSDDSNDPPSAAPSQDIPVFKAGDIVTSQCFTDSELREEMIDTVVNLGSEAMPALFYINSKHTLDEENIEVGNHYSNVFRSLVRGDIYKFIVLWGQVHNQVIDLNDSSPAAVKLRQQAFFDLQSFILYHDLDFPLLVSLADDEGELKSAMKWANAATNLKLSGVELAEQNAPDQIFRTMEIKGFSLSEVSAELQSNGMTEKEFLKMAQERGIDLEHTLMQFQSPRQVNIVCLIALGCKVVTSWLLRFINNGAPIVNLENSYASYLNDADTLVMNYYTGQTMKSPVYTVRYGTKNNPLVEAKFYINTYYRAYHASIPGLYVNRVGMVVSSIDCSGTMHLNGTTVYDKADYEGTGDNLVVKSTGTVTMEYGDCCAVKRKGVLKFNVRGDTGYTQTSWDPQV
jgi:hypothetical protein